ncbi:tRNA (adenosine(37)-N6)-threonylcarbamoyltransferase complex dimerization subunit type 1 TsaB [Desulfothermus naphthae]
MEKTLTLCVNSAEDIIQVALTKNGEFYAGLETNSQKKGIVLIPKMIKQSLELAEVSLESIEKIACVVGPGSFTGLRISLSILTPISITKNIPIGAINYIDLLAFNAFCFLKGTIFVVQYAKIDLFYVQGFSGPDPITPLTELNILNASQVKELITSYKKTQIFGSGVRRYSDFFKDMDITILDPIYDRPSINSLAKYAEKIEYSTNIPKPLYLRPSDAEENLHKIIKNRGLI